MSRANRGSLLEMPRNLLRKECMRTDRSGKETANGYERVGISLCESTARR